MHGFSYSLSFEDAQSTQKASRIYICLYMCIYILYNSHDSSSQPQERPLFWKGEDGRALRSGEEKKTKWVYDSTMYSMSSIEFNGQLISCLQGLDDGQGQSSCCFLSIFRICKSLYYPFAPSCLHLQGGHDLRRTFGGKSLLQCSRRLLG